MDSNTQISRHEFSMKIYLVSGNKYKIREYETIFRELSVTDIQIQFAYKEEDLPEIQG
jgi:inosine/xanthosine triphosphate pyrophosphatase family protein